jgi:hypothetical protein
MNRKHPIFRFLLPVFFIAILVAPVIEKTFHELGHLEEVHCTDKSTLHFHETEHDCSLCDYQVSYGVEPLKNNFSASVYSIDFHFINPVITVPDFYELLALPARAPPLA